MMIRQCIQGDLDEVYNIINDAAEAYRGIIPALVGTWKAADWAIGFYEKHGYRLVTEQQKEQLLRKYWKIPERQVETSVVLADRIWFERAMGQEKK